MNKKLVAAIAGIVVVVGAVIAIVVIVNNNNNKSANDETNDSSNVENVDTVNVDGENNIEVADNNVSNSNSSTKPINSDIVGEWKYFDSYYETPELNFVYIFNADGTGSYGVPDVDSQVFKYEVDGNKLIVRFDTAGAFETTFEVINGDTLNVKDSGGQDTLYKRVK